MSWILFRIIVIERQGMRIDRRWKAWNRCWAACSKDQIVAGAIDD
jgi:hypothetical protein